MSPSYSQPSDDLGYISGDRRLYSEKDLSRSTDSAAVRSLSSDGINNGRQSLDVSAERRTSANMAPHYAVRESSKRTESSQKLPRVDVDETTFEYPGVMGIKNHGNTCFASSIIQCLSNTEFFTEHFVNDHHRAQMVAAEQSGRECAVTDRLARLVESLWTREYTPKLSRGLLKTVRENTDLFADSNGHDAEEFLLYLLNTVNEELYRPLKQDDVKQVVVMLPS